MNRLHRKRSILYHRILLITLIVTIIILEGSSAVAFLPQTEMRRPSLSLFRLNNNAARAAATAAPASTQKLAYTLKERNPYDVHVYFADEAQREEALELRQKMSERFSWMRFYKPKNGPLGPHPIPMWEADFGGYENSSKLGDVRAFLKEEHGNLSVLIHPHSTDGDYADHTRHALWFGETVQLRIRGWK